MIDRIGGGPRIGHRSSEDMKWQETKAAVRKRDGNRCRFEKCLSAIEVNHLVNDCPATLDSAHVLSVGDFPDQTYNVKNVYTLKRFIHRRMDAYQNPLNGRPLDNANEHWYWWWRIIEERVADYDAGVDYKALVFSLIFQ